MHKAFANIKIEPLMTEYHRRVIDDNFREYLSKFLEEQLLPQLEEDYERTEGLLVPVYNEEKYCGPNSAVRDIYRLEFSFIRQSDSDNFKGEICRNPKNGVFRMRRKNQPMILWTKSRKKAQREFGIEIEAIVKRIFMGEVAEWACPQCKSILNVVDSPYLFDTSCPNRCFTYHFHRDSKTKEFLHGHIFLEPR